MYVKLQELRVYFCTFREELQIIFILHFNLLIEWVTRRYRHSADPPGKKDNSISMEPIESSPRIYHVPDVLPLSASNHAFRVYEDVKPPQGGQSAKSQLQRQIAVDMPATQQLSHQPPEPAAPEKQRKMSTQSASSAPPVPTTRRPSDVIPSRQRSFERRLTDTSEPPPVPSTRRPSQCDTTAPNTRRFRSLSEDSPMQVTGFTNTGPLVFGSGRDDPPALVPRVRRPSNGSLSENRSDFPSTLPISGQENLYAAI